MSLSGNKCFQMVELSNQEGDGLNWNEALAECRGQTVDGLRDIDLAAFDSVDESGETKLYLSSKKPQRMYKVHSAIQTIPKDHNQNNLSFHFEKFPNGQRKLMQAVIDFLCQQRTVIVITYLMLYLL